MSEDRDTEASEVQELLEEHNAEESSLQVASELDPATGGTSPMNWERIGLVALLALVAVLLVMQMLGGATSSTVVPGTPVPAPPTTITR